MYTKLESLETKLKRETTTQVRSFDVIQVDTDSQDDDFLSVLVNWSYGFFILSTKNAFNLKERDIPKIMLNIYERCGIEGYAHFKTMYEKKIVVDIDRYRSSK
jgi:hypothetical protein